jgi:hypothetical protein
VPAEQHHDGLKLPHRPRLQCSVQQDSALPSDGRHPECSAGLDTQSNRVNTLPTYVKPEMPVTLRALTGEVPSSEGAEPVRPTTLVGDLPLVLRGMAMGLVADMPEGGAADADVRAKLAACTEQCRHMYRMWFRPAHSDAGL